VPGLLEYIEDN